MTQCQFGKNRPDPSTNGWKFTGNDGLKRWDYLGLAVTVNNGQINESSDSGSRECDEELVFWDNNPDSPDRFQIGGGGVVENGFNRAAAEWVAGQRGASALPATSLDDIIDQIKAGIERQPCCNCYRKVTLANHGYTFYDSAGNIIESGVAYFGGNPVVNGRMNNDVLLRNQHDKLAEIARYICPEGTLEILGCNTMGNDERQGEMLDLADRINRSVQGYTASPHFVVEVSNWVPNVIGEGQNLDSMTIYPNN
jgi:hypothetical protein